MLATPLAAAYSSYAFALPPMKITRVETVYWKSREDAPFWPHWTWLKIDTDAGVSGIGETYPRNPVEAAMVHNVAPSLIGRDPRDIERIWADLYRTFDFQIAGGTEMRVLSALDLALWDLLGKSLNAPVYRLIGGKANPQVRLYNTCFDYKYDFNKEPEKIMRELIDTRGIKAIKIWPFDGAALRNKNEYITWHDIDQALIPVKKLRDTFGDEIEIAIEFHAQWNLTSAIRIAHALEPYKPMWLEDMLMPGNFDQYHQLAASNLIAAYRRRTHGRQDAVRAAAGIAHAQIRDVRRHLVRRPDRSPQDRRSGRCPGAAHRAPHSRRPTTVLRVHPSDHGIAERMDPGKLPEILRTRLAADAGKPHRAQRWFYPGARGKRLRHADQARSLEPSRLHSRRH